MTSWVAPPCPPRCININCATATFGSGRDKLFGFPSRPVWTASPAMGKLNRLHGPLQEIKLLHHDGLKGLRHQGLPMSQRKLRGARLAAEATLQFIALSVPVAGPPAPASTTTARIGPSDAITLEFKRGALGVSGTWPVGAASACANWPREVFRWSSPMACRQVN